MMLASAGIFATIPVGTFIALSTALKMCHSAHSSEVETLA